MSYVSNNTDKYYYFLCDIKKTSYAVCEYLKITARCETNTFCNKSAKISSHLPHNMGHSKSQTSTYVCQFISLVVSIILLASIFRHLPNIQALSSFTAAVPNKIIEYDNDSKWPIPNYFVEDDISQNGRQENGKDEKYQGVTKRRNNYDLELPLRRLWIRLIQHQGINTNYDRGAIDECQVKLVESIPEGLIYPNSTIPENPSTYSAFVQLLDLAESKLELASSYWTLRGSDLHHQDPSSWQGENIFRRIEQLAKSQRVKIKIAQDQPGRNQPNQDTADLSKIFGVEVRSLNFSALMGAGILHTKLWLVDRRHFYVGSANFDWRSLTQVKEMGVLVLGCPTLAEDMGKIFDVYWKLGGPGKVVPDTWPPSLSTDINPDNPLSIKNKASLNEKEELSVYLSSSPPPFCPDGRVTDKNAILRMINSAERFVHIAVMDYYPITIYTHPPKFWPLIDNALRRAAIERGVKVKLLLSNWTSTRPDMKGYLRTLTDLSRVSKKIDVQGKFFQVPSFTPAQKAIPYARVNHNKYIVTEQSAMIGTSNWTPDYFLHTGGIGFIFSSNISTNNVANVSSTVKEEQIQSYRLRRPSRMVRQLDNIRYKENSVLTTSKYNVNVANMHQQLSDVFMRDWNSPYSSENV